MYARQRDSTIGNGTSKDVPSPPCIALYSAFLCSKLKNTNACLLDSCEHYERFQTIKVDNDGLEILDISSDDMADAFDLAHRNFISSPRYVDFLRNEIPRSLQSAYLFLDWHTENQFQNRRSFILKVDKLLSSFKLSSRQISRVCRLMWGELYDTIKEDGMLVVEEQESEQVRLRMMRGEDID